MAVLSEIKVPLLSVNDTTLTIAQVLRNTGELVKKGDLILVFETSKTSYDVEAEADGFIEYFCEPGADYDVNSLVARIVSSEADISETAKDNRENTVRATDLQPVFENKSIQWKGETIFSNEALRLMKEEGIAASKFSGRDFVSKNEVLALMGFPKVQVDRKLKSATTERHPQKPVSIVNPDEVSVKKLSSNKKKEIEFLSSVQSPGLTSTINVYVETRGIFTQISQSLKYLKNSLLPVVIFETGRLLRKYPLLNAFFHENAISFYNDVHVGFAIDIDKGLKVLRIQHTDKRSIHEIEQEVLNLSDQYIEDKLPLESITGITFTITDLSAENVAFFRPLVNNMNSAILAISSVDEKLQRSVLSLTFDHRVTEGKLAAQFLNDLKSRIESYRATDVKSLTREFKCFKCGKSLDEDFSGVGFVKCVTSSGDDAYVCQPCFKGF